MCVTNQPGVMASIATIFGQSGISIDSVVQKGSGRADEEVNIIFLTQQTLEGNLNSALAEVENLDTVKGKINRLRLERLS